MKTNGSQRTPWRQWLPWLVVLVVAAVALPACTAPGSVASQADLDPQELRVVTIQLAGIG